MKLGIRFSPPPRGTSGSQHTIADLLVPEIARLHPDTVVLTATRGAFPAIDPVRIVDVSPQVAPGSTLRTLAGLARTYFDAGGATADAGCDVIYYPYTFESLQRTRAAQIVTVHDLLPLAYPDLYPRTGALWRHLLIPHLRTASAIITPSTCTREGLITQGRFERRRIRVIPQGFQPMHSAAPTPGDRTPYLLYVASSRYPYKNIAFLLRVFESISARIPHGLVVVGADDARFTPALEAQRRTMPSGARVELRSGVSSEALQALYADAALFVYPSEFEGFGIPPLEAMASGVPVAASDAASIPEVCGAAARYFSPWDEAGAAEAILEILGNSRLRDDLVDAGRRRAATFNWTRTAEAIVALAHEVHHARPAVSR